MDRIEACVERIPRGVLDPPNGEFVAISLEADDVSGGQRIGGEVGHRDERIAEPVDFEIRDGRGEHLNRARAIQICKHDAVSDSQVERHDDVRVQDVVGCAGGPTGYGTTGGVDPLPVAELASDHIAGRHETQKQP